MEQVSRKRKRGVAKMVANVVAMASDDYPELKRADSARGKISLDDEVASAGSSTPSNTRHKVGYVTDSEDDDGPIRDVYGPKAGLADAMSKILRSTGSDAAPIMAKAKVDKPKKADPAVLAAEREAARLKKEQKHADHIEAYDPLYSISMEAKLKRIATRGVVMLFNAVRKKQRQSDDDEDSDSVGKRKFLDMLKDTAAKRDDPSSYQSKSDAGSGDGWKVVQDGFMTKGKAADWADDENDDDADDMAAAGLDSGDSE